MAGIRLVGSVLGEYLTYTLDIPETGTYRLDARCLR
jgi:hypothetical protein